LRITEVQNLKPGDKTSSSLGSRLHYYSGMVGFTIGVHNGKTHIRFMWWNMVGHAWEIFFNKNSLSTRQIAKAKREAAAPKPAAARQEEK